MKNHYNERESQQDITKKRLERRRSILLLGLFTIALLSGAKSRPGLPSTVWDWSTVIALFAALAVMLWAVVRNYQQSDELQQSVQLKAAALSFAVVITALFTASILDMMTLVKPVALLQIATIGSVVCWYVCLHVLTERSRR